MIGRKLTSTSVRALVATIALLGGLGAHAWAAPDGPPGAAPKHQPDSPTRADAATPPAPSDSTQAEAGGVQEVTITGSRIKAANLVSESPVTAVSDEDIKAQGVTNIESVLNELPQFHVGQNMTAVNHSTGVASLNLRGLGPTRTLVLIDGRRLGPGDPQDANGAAADVNFIPAALVTGVDVLTGGASAVYGSDAIAGVVNFHLIRNFQGVQITETMNADQHTQHGTLDPQLQSAPYPTPVTIPGNQLDGFATDTTLVMGTNTAEDKGNVTLYAEYRTVNPVLDGTRDFQGCSITLNKAQTGLVCSGSSNSVYGNFQTNSGLTLALNPNGSATFVPFTKNLKYSNTPTLYLQRQDDRSSLGAIGHQQINPWVDVYAEVMFMQDRTVAQSAPGGLSSGGGPTGFIQVPCNNQFLSAAEAPYICQDASGNPLPVYQANGQPNVATILMPSLRIAGYPGLDNFEHTDYRAVVGARGDINSSWSYDVSGTYWDSLLSEHFLNDIAFTKVQNAINGCTAPANPGCVPLNIFQYGGITPAMFNYITTPGLKTGDSIEETLDANVSGNFGAYGGTSPWARNPLATALGVSYRRDSLSFLPDYELQTNQLLGQGSFFLPVSGAERVVEEYAELRIPLVESKPLAEAIDLDLAGRHSAYTIDTASNGISTNTFKIAADYSPDADIRLRASYNRAARAPNLYELFLPNTLSGDTGYNDPCAGATPVASLSTCAKTGVTAAQYGKIPDCPAANCGALFGGNTALKPEVANTISFGLNATPRFLPSFNASIDYWDVRIKNYVTNLSGAEIVNGCLLQGNDSLCGLIHRGNVGQLFGTTGYIVETNTNFGELHNRGIDIDLNYRQSLGAWGALAMKLTGTYLLEQSVSTVVSYNCAGLYGPICSSGGDPGPNFRWRHNARLTWVTPWDVDVSLNWRYLSAVKLDLNDSQPALNGGSYDAYDAVIPAYNFFDLSASWQFWNSFTLRFGINNILDKDPPISSDLAIYNRNGGANGNVYTGTYDSLGRTMFLSVNAKF
jgi:iron complex outermembrane recepter protein